MAAEHSAALEAALDAHFRLWFCPIDHPRYPIRETVRWDGDFATCLDCGRTNHDVPCPNCGEIVRLFGVENPHYIPSVGHYAEPGDSIKPHWTCTRSVA